MSRQCTTRRSAPQRRMEEKMIDPYTTFFAERISSPPGSMNLTKFHRGQYFGYGMIAPSFTAVC
jgi:hypothetical protein